MVAVRAEGTPNARGIKGIRGRAGHQSSRIVIQNGISAGKKDLYWGFPLATV